nr:unnamed protein product [Ipomoea batatas]GME03683.1 unnamed protein product [Ipomoea batatas]GME10695.1 unnamed protein product [Ipomoea batatas]
MHLPFKISNIEATIWSVFFRAPSPSSNLARRDSIAREVPERSSLSALSTSLSRTGMAPDLTATVQFPWNWTSSARELRRWWEAWQRGLEIASVSASMLPATPNLALFLSSIARLHTTDAAILQHSSETCSERMRELRNVMDSMSARDFFRLGFRERLKSVESARTRTVMEDEEDLDRPRSRGIAPSA